MSSVNQAEQSDHSVDSARSSAIGLMPASHERAEYMRMIPPTAEKFYGEENTMPIQHWLDHTTLWMTSIGVPYRHRTSVASLMLRSEALTFWKEYVDNNGDDLDWDEFVFVMGT